MSALKCDAKGGREGSSKSYDNGLSDWAKPEMVVSPGQGAIDRGR